MGVQADDVSPPPADGAAAAAEGVEMERLIREHSTLVANDKWYVVAMTWWRRWRAHCGLDVHNDKDAADDEKQPDDDASKALGAIDNNCLLADPAAEHAARVMRPGLLCDVDYVLLPEAAWSVLRRRHKGGPEVLRRVIAKGAGAAKQLQVEVYKLEFSIRRLRSNIPSTPFRFSHAAKLSTLLAKMTSIFSIRPDDVQLYRAEGESDATLKLGERIGEDVNDAPEQTLEEAGINAGDVFFAASRLDFDTVVTAGAARAANSGFDFSRSRGFASASSSASSSLSSPRRLLLCQRGQCGLGNLGNTCFMNSSLQCLLNTRPLVEYFLSGAWKTDLNTDNPLGMSGEVAQQFARLCTEYWSAERDFSSLAPRRFKATIGKFAPQFSGYAQHDSQELLGFLLDGLHEDLNRVRKKPYVEGVDSDGSEPDALVAAKAWERHRMRNDSVIVDKMQGQFKSTVVCPTCAKVSITFDPFMYVSVPIPAKADRHMSVVVVLPTSRAPERYSLALPKIGTVADMKAALADAVNADRRAAGANEPSVSASSFVVAEVFQARFHKFFTDGDKLRSISDQDRVFAYVLDAAAAAADAGVPPSALMALPVVHVVRRPHPQSNNPAGLGDEMSLGFPFVVLTPRRTTYRALHKLCDTRVRKCLAPRFNRPPAPPSSNGDNSDDSDSDDSDSARGGGSGGGGGGGSASTELDLDAVFSLRIVRWSARNQALRDLTDCGDEELVLPGGGRHEALAIEWDLFAYHEMYDEQVAIKCTNNASVDAAERRDGTGGGDGLTVEDCLAAFAKNEQLGKNDAWFCPRCKDHVQAHKKMEIWRAPDTLVLHLKRFSYDRYYRDKIDTLVRFPIQGLRLTSALARRKTGTRKKPDATSDDDVEDVFEPNPQDDDVYDLYAVSNHYGGLGGGHYRASARSPVSPDWFSYDDSFVEKTTRLRADDEREAALRKLLPAEKKKQENDAKTGDDDKKKNDGDNKENDAATDAAAADNAADAADADEQKLDPNDPAVSPFYSESDESDLARSLTGTSVYVLYYQRRKSPVDDIDDRRRLLVALERGEL